VVTGEEKIMNAYLEEKFPNGITKINIYLTQYEIDTYIKTESSTLLLEISRLLDLIIRKAENGNPSD